MTKNKFRKFYLAGRKPRFKRRPKFDKNSIVKWLFPPDPYGDFYSNLFLVGTEKEVEELMGAVG